MKINLLELDLDAMKKVLVENGLKPYGAQQLCDWIYKKHVYDFDRMTNFKAEDRKRLAEKFSIDLGEIHTRLKSKEDDSVKLLIQFADGQMAETVMIPRDNRRTVCVSSQVGCKFGCVFCASGQAGFARQLTPGEIAAQVLRAAEESDERGVTHVVFMGMGEPFDNYETLMEVISRLNNPKMFGIGARRITVSTSGLVSKIDEFIKKPIQAELSISLHGANDEVRSKLMPINRKWPVKELVKACREYSQKTNRQITFEYLLAEGLNASPQDAQELAALLKGSLCKVNLIPLNPIPEFKYKRPEYEDIVRFQSVLENSGIKATVRFSRGQDINAACGQLRRVSMGIKEN